MTNAKQPLYEYKSAMEQAEVSMAYTLLLNTNSWDIQLDAAGRIATTTGAYAVAQNVSNAVRLFTKDAWYAQADGIPHFNVELGQRPSADMVREHVNRTARAVPEVASASTTLRTFEGRTLSGEITLTTTSGEVIHAAF